MNDLMLYFADIIDDVHFFLFVLMVFHFVGTAGFVIHSTECREEDFKANLRYATLCAVITLIFAILLVLLPSEEFIRTFIN